MKRKIIQLEETAKCTLALCDDGTVYKLTSCDRRPLAYEYTWEELPPLPEKQIERNFIGRGEISKPDPDLSYTKGIEAGLNNLGGSNPYPVGSFEANCWVDGYTEGIKRKQR